MLYELQNYSKIPPCTYGLLQVFIKEQDEKILQFLMGLDEAPFGTILSQILGIEPMPSLSRAYAMVTKEESHTKVVRSQMDKSK